MTDTHIYRLEACVDCIMLLANAETPPEMTEDETAAYLAQIETVWPSEEWIVVYDGCGDNEEHHIDFTWARCEICERPSNAGERCYAAAWRQEANLVDFTHDTEGTHP